MQRFTDSWFQMGPEFEIMRDGICVATKYGNPSEDENCITFPYDTNLKAGDVVVGKITREEFVVERVRQEVSGNTVMYIEAFRSNEKRDDRSSTHVIQNIGTVHGAVAGRDLHGDITLNNMTVGDVLNYLKNEIEKSASPEEKKTLLEKLGDLSKHPIIVNLASVGLGQVVKWLSGTP
jgi:hypothetical protein